MFSPLASPRFKLITRLRRNVFVLYWKNKSSSGGAIYVRISVVSSSLRGKSTFNDIKAEPLNPAEVIDFHFLPSTKTTQLQAVIKKAPHRCLRIGSDTQQSHELKWLMVLTVERENGGDTKKRRANLLLFQALIINWWLPNSRNVFGCLARSEMCKLDLMNYSFAHAPSPTGANFLILRRSFLAFCVLQVERSNRSSGIKGASKANKNNSTTVARQSTRSSCLTFSFYLQHHTALWSFWN